MTVFTWLKWVLQALVWRKNKRKEQRKDEE
jgi:hypothetical protein